LGEFALIGYSLAALLFMVLSGLLATVWRGRLSGGLLLLASLMTALWAAAAGIQAGFRAVPTDLLWALEVVRNLGWLAVLFRLLSPFAEHSPVYFAVLRYVQIAIFLLGFLLLLSLVDIDWIDRRVQGIQLESELRLIVHLLFAVVGMALVEQLFRNTPAEHRWSIKYLCLGLGTLFVFDFYLYTDALLFHRIDLAGWSARGVVAAMTVPMIGMAAARNPRLDLPVVMSRSMVFHTTTLFTAGVYMLLMALAGYYIKFYGGDWGSALQIAFVAGALLFLIVALLSGRVRARAKVFLNKHFFNYQYDYRDEWLRLIGLLSGRKSTMPLGERVIWALGEIVESDGGVLFQCSEEGQCRCVAGFNHPELSIPPLEANDPLVAFLDRRQWIVDLDEYREDPAVYEDMELPDWLGLMRSPWLVVPLVHDERVRGFVVLKQPRAPQEINWESMDLLKTAGTQAASYLTLNEAAEALAEARQFEGFNRLSAFVMHDLKNLIAQLSLVARNAAKHKHNPAFIDDAVRTIDNAVAKMNRLMEQLKTAGMSPEAREVDLVGLLRHMVESRAGSRPEPTLTTAEASLSVMAEPDRLTSVIGHIVQNAQDATPPDGHVQIELRRSNDQAIVSIRDTGTGMDEEFVRNRLFRPFDSTKGLTGMGIGAYECREFVRAIGGQVEVDSAVGRGTTFVIILPALIR
jgi:putative PEP-CTERM system histidine kinase